MGLDLDIVKFKKEYFDSKKGKYNSFNSYQVIKDGDDKLYQQLAYWHKHYDIRSLLSKFCGYGACEYFEITRLQCKKILRIAVRGINRAKFNAVEMKSLVKVLRKILHQTNFKEETIAFDWVS